MRSFCAAVALGPEPVRDHDMEVPEAMGSAITSDFVLAADEVKPVLRALRSRAALDQVKVGKPAP
jgi:hypothetical protein